MIRTFLLAGLAVKHHLFPGERIDAFARLGRELLDDSSS